MSRARAATRVIGFALLFVLPCIAQPAAASEPLVHWSAPPECPSANDLKDHILQLMGGGVESNLAAAVRVTRHADSYRAHVVLRGPGGTAERDFENARCDLLQDSVAVLIALSIPNQQDIESRGQLGAVALAVRASVQGRIVSGALPLTAAGVGGAVALEAFSSVRLEVHGAYYFPQSATLAETMLGSRFALLAAGIRACRLWSIGLLELGPCTGAELYHVSTRAFGGMPSLASNILWWGPALGAFSRLNVIGPLSICVAAEAIVPLSRPRFRFWDVGGDLHHVAAVAPQVTIAGEVRF